MITSPPSDAIALSLPDMILTNSPALSDGDSENIGFNTFYLASEDDVGLKEIPTGNVDPSRLKRPHHKSRSGCSNCRKRRVKCDEKPPRCSHCSRRGEKCDLASANINHVNRATLSSPSKTLQQPPLISQSESSHHAVNMMHMKLFHHFDTSTRHTLCFGSVWKEALGWSLEYEGLMHAILCVSARHLAYLCPEDPAYGVTAASHFTQALSKFRKDIDQPFTASNCDFFMATSVLIYVELWTETEFLVTESSGLTTLDLSRDGLFQLAGGLFEIFRSSGPVLYERPSSFLGYIIHRPRQALDNASGLDQETLDTLQAFFSYKDPLRYEQLSIASAFNATATSRLTTSMTGQDSEEAHLQAAHGDVVSRLATLLLFLPELQRPQFPNVPEQLMPDLTRYAFTFPLMIHVYAVNIICKHDLKGLLLLYHFYKTVRTLLGSVDCWWSHKRARLLEALLEKKLQNAFNGTLIN